MNESFAAPFFCTNVWSRYYDRNVTVYFDIIGQRACTPPPKFRLWSTTSQPWLSPASIYNSPLPGHVTSSFWPCLSLICSKVRLWTSELHCVFSWHILQNCARHQYHAALIIEQLPESPWRAWRHSPPVKCQFDRSHEYSQKTRLYGGCVVVWSGENRGLNLPVPL